MPNLELRSLTRNLEILMEGFQGIEELANNNIDRSAADVSRAMIPLNLQMEVVLQRLKRLADITAPPKQPEKSELIVFPNLNNEKHTIEPD